MQLDLTSDLVQRAAWTFLQAFIAALASMPFTNADGFVVVLVAALAAGLSAVKTSLVERRSS
jgi:hypothetical protein